MARMNAIVGLGRLNAFRLNDLISPLRQHRDYKLTITLDGAPLRVRLNTLSIQDVINDSPNTCSFVADNATPPTVGKRLRITLGVQPVYLLFAGILQAAEDTYVGRPSVQEWHCQAVDDTGRSDWLRPFGAWEGISATTVAQQIVATYCPSFNANGVQAGLAPVTLYLDGTERVNGALRQIAKLIGGYFYWEDYTLHLYVGDEAGGPDPITGTKGQLLDDPPIHSTSDDSQIRTRCYGKGHGEATLAAVDANEARLPIANAVMFNTAGGQAIIESQKITYTGTVIGGGGALVGPGVTPSAAPTGTVQAGTGIEAGLHNYAYVWVTAAGKTLPSPTVAITVGDTPTPTTAPTVAADRSTWSIQAGHVVGDTLQVAICFSGDISATIGVSPLLVGGSIVVPVWDGGGNNPAVINWTVPAYVRPSALAAYVQIFVSKNGGGYWRETSAARNINGFPVGSTVPVQTGILASYGSGSAYPGPNPAARQVNVSGVAIGPAGVTAREIYRTVAGGGGALKFLTTIANNTATTFLDTLADATLGAAAPASDTSNLQMAAGQVLPGATVIPVSSTAWAIAAGGWAVVGNGAQVIRYTGISGNTITGIPAAGNGAITAAVNYNSTISGPPMLLGVSGLAIGIRKGAPVCIWVQVDDAGAQSTLAARVGGSGIIENLITDERRGEPSLLAICRADLSMYGYPIVTVQYACFDPKTRSGRTVHIGLPQLGLNTDLLIQSVSIDHFQPKPTRAPRFTVTASSVRTSFEDLLRRLAGTLTEGF